MATPFLVLKTPTGFGFQFTKALSHFRELQSSEVRDYFPAEGGEIILCTSLDCKAIVRSLN